VEGGPDGFLAAEPHIQELAREVGVGDRLVDQVARGATLWTGRGLEPLPEGKAAELLGIQGNANVGAFRSFAAGMQEIVDALVARLAPRLRTTQGVTAVAPAARGWRLSFTGASSLDAEAVILAVPAWVAARLLAGVGVSAARSLDTVLYAPSITVSLAYRADQVTRTPEGTGFVSASDWGGAVRACTYAWRKYPKRAPEGHALLRAFVGPVDGDPAAVAHAELAAILGLEGAPLWTRSFHWPRGLPRYPRGYAGRDSHGSRRLRSPGRGSTALGCRPA
jgi:oxygen-dependent protoporphyrinogen oxidase